MSEAEAKISSALLPLGFKRKGRTWRRSVGSATQVVNIQPGFGRLLHINLGVYYEPIASAVDPTEEVCHVRARLERVSGGEAFEAIRSLEVGSAPSPAVLSALVRDGIAFLDNASTAKGLRTFLERSEVRDCFVHRLAREWSDPGAGV